MSKFRPLTNFITATSLIWWRGNHCHTWNSNLALTKGKEDGRKNWKPRGKIGISCVVVIVTSSN